MSQNPSVSFFHYLRRENKVKLKMKNGRVLKSIKNRVRGFKKGGKPTNHFLPHLAINPQRLRINYISIYLPTASNQPVNYRESKFKHRWFPRSDCQKPHHRGTTQPSLAQSCKNEVQWICDFLELAFSQSPSQVQQTFPQTCQLQRWRGKKTLVQKMKYSQL